MESTRTNSLNKGLETLGALITRAKSSFQNGRAHHSTNETKWQHILVRNNVESSITLCFWSLFPLSLPASPTHAEDKVQASIKSRQGRRTHTRWHRRAVPHMSLGRLDHLNCPLESSPVKVNSITVIQFWPLLERLAMWPFDALCVWNSKHTSN